MSKSLQFLYFYILRPKDGVTRTSDSFPGILIRCEKVEYRRPSPVDANVINKVIATRGCTGGNGPDELTLRSESEGCVQGASPRSMCVLLSGQTDPKHTGNFPSMHVCSGDTLY